MSADGELEAATLNSDLSSAELCRARGWGPGTRLAGDEGYGLTVIEITAVGESAILARAISHNGEDRDGSEGSWTLRHREWHPAPPAPGYPKGPEAP